MKTDRKIKAEKRLPKIKAVKGTGRVEPRSNGKHLLAAYEHIPVGIVEASPDGKYLDVNEEFCRILGYSRRSLLRRGIKDCTHEDDYGIDLRLHEQLVTGKIPYYKIEKRYARKDGESIWVEITRSLVCDEQGKPLRTVGVVLDISDRKDVEHVLRESVERLRLATGAAHMFMWEWDFQTQSYTIADSFEQVLGFSAGLLPKNKFETLLALSPKEDIESVSEAFEKAVELQRDLHAVPYRVINPENGQVVWLELSAKIVYDRQGKPERMFGVAQNITENKKAETALQLARKQAEQSADRTARLQKVTAALSEALTPPQVAEVLMKQGAPALGAVTSSIILLSEDGQTLETLHSTSAEALISRYKRFPISLQVPAADAARSGQPVWLESRQQYLERYPHLAEQINLWGQQAAIAIPMLYKERILGVLTLSFDRVLSYNLQDLDYALTLARQGAQALDRARAENALRESEERFRALVSQATAGISETDLDGHLIFVNPRFCEMLGYAETELLGKTIWELTFTEDLQENRRLFKRMVKQDKPYQFEKRFIRKDGSLLWTNVSVTVIHDSAGEPKGGVGVVLDIEKRKQAEAALTEYARQQEALYRLSDDLHHTEVLAEVFDASLDAIMSALQCDRASILLFDDSKRMRFVAWRGLSDAYRKATDGHSPWTPEEKDPQPLIMDDVRTADLSDSLRAVIQAEGIGSLAFIPLVSNGTLVGKFMVYFDAPHTFGEGELDLSQMIARQLASGIDRKRADVQLRESEQRYRAVVESQAEMLCRFRPDGSILFVNGAYARARGTTPEELAQHNFWEFVAEEDRPSVQAMLDSLTPEDPQVQIENRFYTMDGERWTLWTNRALSFDAGGRWLEAQSSGIDITERKQVEEALRASEERMRLATDAAGMYAWEFDVQNHSFKISENFPEVIGFPAELIPENSLDALQSMSPAEDAQIVRDALTGAFEMQQDLRDLQYRIVNPQNGQVVWVEVNARTIYDREGRPERMYGVSQNISERKRSDDVLRIRARQQHAVAKLGELALRERDLQTVFDRSTAMISETLEIEFCKVLELLEGGQAMLLRAGVGWQEGLVGRARIGAGLDSQAGFTLHSTRPVIVHDLRHEQRFNGPSLLIDHGIVSGMSCIIYGADGHPWGVIGAHSSRQISFTEDDVNFLVAVANILGDAIYREQVEKALARERELLNRIFESIPVMLTISDPSSNLLRLNRQFEQLIGWSTAETAGTSLMEATYPDPQYREKVGQFMDRCVENEWMDIQMRTRDGHTLETSWSNIRLSNDLRVGIGIDITERKRAEEQLRESEQRYRFIVENTSDGIWWIELTEPMPITLSEEEQIDWYYKHAVIRQCNLGMARMYGYDSIEEAIGLPLRVVMPREDPVNLELSRQFVRSGYRLVDAESRERDRDGHQLIFLNNMVGIIEDGRLKGEWGTNRDITERKQAEEALRASESLYRTIARSIPGGGVYVVDKDFRYLVAEGPVTKAFGLSREMLEGRTVIEAFPDERGRRMEDRLQRTFAGEIVSFETTHNGRFYWTQQAPLLDSIGHAIIVTLDITERKRAEEALRQSEERFAHFMQHLPGLAWIKDMEGRYLYANAAAEKAFNTPREMLYGLRDEDIFPVDVAEQFRKNDEMAVKDEKGVQVIETLKHADGLLHFSLVSKFPIPGPDGSTSLIGGTAFDVTERLRAEEALRESEERFRAILRQATAGIVRKDAEGRLTFVNDAFCNMLGYTESELLGKTVWEFMHPDDVAENKRSYDRLMLEGIPFKLERRFLRADGSVIWVDASVSPIMDSTGKSQSAVAVEVDITGHKLAEEALRASEERYRNLFDLVPVAVYSCDAEGLIQEYNHRAIELWGREPKKNDPNEKYCGSFKIYYPDGRFMPHDQCPMARALKGEALQPPEYESLVEREDGQRRNVVAHPLILRNEYGEITGAINCLYDITDRKQAEEALQQLNLQLEERVLSRTAKLREVNQTLRDEIAERQRIEDALRKSEAAARENEEKLSTLFGLLPVGISFLSPDGQIIQMNPALAHILKMPKELASTEAARSRKYIRANGTMMPPTEFASRRALSEGRTVYNVETGVILEDSEVVWTSESAAPVNVADVGAVVVTVDITESKRAERALQESRERLQVLSQRLVEVQEDERRAIARELHDRVGQTLAALNINLIIISGQLGGQVDEQISTRLSDSMKLVAETIALVRDVMSNLRPSVLDDYGLEAAIESHLTQFTSRYEIQTKFEKPPQPIPRLGPSIEMTFLRIAQEALMNTVKHAQASQVKLSLRREENTVFMTVQDNGTGIRSWQNANRPGSHGLTIMRERAEAFGGNLKVNSVPGKGTIVEVKIPIDTADRSQSEKEQSQ